MFENPRRGRKARNFTTNVPKILDLKSPSDQIFSRKLPLGVPDSNHQRRPYFWEAQMNSSISPSSRQASCNATRNLLVDVWSGKLDELTLPRPLRWSSIPFLFFVALVPNFSTNSQGNTCFAGFIFWSFFVFLEQNVLHFLVIFELKK